MNPEPAQSPDEPAKSGNEHRSRRRLLGSAAVVAGAAGLGWAWWRDQVNDGAPSSPAASGAPAGTGADAALQAFWRAQFETPTGQTLATAHFKGRPVLINFWATWCPPCVEELPLIEAFYRQNSPNGWQVLAIAADKLAAVNTFLGKLPLSFPVVIAGLEGVALSRSLGNVAGGLPFTVVVGRDGQVIQRKMGQLKPEDLRAWALMR